MVLFCNVRRRSRSDVKIYRSSELRGTWAGCGNKSHAYLLLIISTRSQYGHSQSVRSWWQILPQHQSTYLRGPGSASIEISPFKPGWETGVKKVKYKIHGICSCLKKVFNSFFVPGETFFPSFSWHTTYGDLKFIWTLLLFFTVETSPFWRSIKNNLHFAHDIDFICSICYESFTISFNVQQFTSMIEMLTYWSTHY